MQDIEIISFSFFSHYLLDDFRSQALYQNLYTLCHLHFPKLLRQVLHKKKMGPEKIRVFPMSHGW